MLIIQTFRPSPSRWVSLLGNFPTGVCGMIPLTLTGPGFGHWRMWSYQRSPAPLGKPCLLPSHSLGVWGILPQRPLPQPCAFPSGLCGRDPGQVSRRRNSLAALLVVLVWGRAPSSLWSEPLSCLESCPPLHIDQVFGVTSVMCGRLA